MIRLSLKDKFNLSSVFRKVMSRRKGGIITDLQIRKSLGGKY